MKNIVLHYTGFLIYRMVKIARGYHYYLFKYPTAFGHQSMNVEYYARKVKTINNAKLIAFYNYRKNYIPNKSLYAHHIESGLYILTEKMICKLLDIGLTYQKEYIEKRGGNKDSAFLTCTLQQLYTDPIAHIESSVAYPLTSKEKGVADSVLNKLSLERDQYYTFQDRNLDYHLWKKKLHNIDSIFSIDKINVESIEDYYPAAKLMQNFTIKAVRVGSRSNPIHNNAVVDFPGIYRDKLGDFSDLAVMEGGKFHVGPTSGVDGLAVAFNKPRLLCNVFPWPWQHVPMNEKSIVMPKKLWLIKEKRMMTLQEMINMEDSIKMKKLRYDEEWFKSLEIEVINNSSEEICLAVDEINARIDERWTGDNYPLSILLSDRIGSVSKSYLSTAFVQLNKEISKGIVPQS